ncbi:MAG: methyltransferase domain-containing protein [Myxococcota bacterium]|nr:methyltransferase domain-containing protein [Myxococcota bacterium]
MSIRITVLEDARDREAVFRFRYRIQADEQGLELPGMNHAERNLVSPLDEGGVLLAAIDQETGATVGTLRTTLADAPCVTEDLLNRLSLSKVVEQLGGAKVALTGDLMVDPAYKGRTVTSLLVTRMYQLGLELDIDIDTCQADLTLVNLYQQLGYRPYAEPTRPDEVSGLRLPLALTMRDAKHLFEVRSPFRRFLAADCDDEGAMARQMQDMVPDFHSPPVNPRELRALWAGLAESTLKRREYSLLDDLDDDQAEGLLEICPTIEVPKGETIYRLGEQHKGMGMVLEGEIGVTLEETPDPHLIAVLGPGQVFGEMAGVLGVGRTARLLALERTKVMLLPDTAFDLLDMEAPPVGRQISRNLVRILCERLHAMNKLVAGTPVRLDEQIRTTTPITASLTDEGSNNPDNPEFDLQTRERESQAGQEIEGHWLRRLGLNDSSTFLTIGSGPGITPVLLAGLFPNSKIIGVEPDEALRSHAQRRVTDLALQERCSFLEGHAEQLPLERNSVDFAYARLLLHKVPNPKAVISEMVRVTRPGGTIAVLDVDDAAVVVYPEPPEFRDFQERAALARAEKGGNRNIGRELSTLFATAGIEGSRVEMLPLTSGDLPIDLLMDVAFGSGYRLIQKTNREQPNDKAMMRTLMDLNNRPDAWVAIPLFLAHGRLPNIT